MAFFDEIGKKLSQTGQGMVQKTKEMADVAKLNSNISDEEKKLSDTYFQIGQLYVQLHNEDFESNFKELIMQIKESQENIEKFKQEIQEIKGIKRCDICGAEISNNATFCSSCGTAVAQKKAVNAANLTKCTNCGKMIEKGMRFCTFCGREVVVQQNDNTVNKCLSCGSLLATDAAFCTQCGATVHKSDEELSGQSETERPVADTSIQPDTAEAVVESTAEQQEMNIQLPPVQPIEKRCLSCGATLAEDALFCTECGTKVN